MAQARDDLIHALRGPGDRPPTLSGELEGDAVEQVALAAVDPVEAVTAEHLAHDQRAGDDHRGAVGVEIGDLPALGEGGAS